MTYLPKWVWFQVHIRTNSDQLIEFAGCQGWEWEQVLTISWWSITDDDDDDDLHCICSEQCCDWWSRSGLYELISEKICSYFSLISLEFTLSWSLVSMVTPLAATSRSWLCLRHHCCHWQIIFTAGDCEPGHDWSVLKSETEEFNIIRWYREASHTQE